MKNNVIIAFASGKGGTGKTSLAVNFAKYISKNNDVLLSDLDVEEPNSKIFFSASNDKASYDSSIQVPVINDELCNYCGDCAEKCNFNAITVLKNKTMTFNELCKGCLRCGYVCKKGAITFDDMKIGVINEYSDGDLKIREGVLKIGSIQTAALIKDAKNSKPVNINIYDCPPGTTCPMVESIEGADYIVLVTEPTPFGLHDLTLAIEVAIKMDKRFSIVINKSGNNDKLIEEYCHKNSYKVMAKIPFSKEIAQKCGMGKFYYNEEPYKSIFEKLFNQISGEF